MTDAPPFDTEWERHARPPLRARGRAAQHRDLLDDRLEPHELVREPAGARVGFTATFVDTTDQALDVSRSPTAHGGGRTRTSSRRRSSSASGQEAEAAEIRAEGERVIAVAPWPTGWEDWRPPASGARSGCRGTGMWSEGETVVRREVLRRPRVVRGAGRRRAATTPSCSRPTCRSERRSRSPPGDGRSRRCTRGRAASAGRATGC